MLSNLTRLFFKSESFGYKLDTIQVSESKVSIGYLLETYCSSIRRSSLVFYSIGGHFHACGFIVVRIFFVDALCLCEKKHKYKGDL